LRSFGVFFFFTLVTGPRRSLGLRLGDTRVYEPQIRGALAVRNVGVKDGKRLLLRNFIEKGFQFKTFLAMKFTTQML